MTKHYLIALALLVVGCGNSNGNGNGNNDMSMNGGGGTGGTGGGAPDMATPLDMADTTMPPAPTTMRLGPMTPAPTAGLVTAGVTAAAYLVNPAAGTPSNGELHVVTAAGVDKTVDTGVSLDGYLLTADAKHIIYTKPATNGGALFWADVSAATVTPKAITFGTGTYAAPTLTQGGVMAPSTHFFLAGVRASGVAASLDLHVIDMSNGNDVYDRLNGGFDYLELVLPDDTMLFQDTAGCTSAGGPCAQTLYSISLTGVTMSSMPTTITTHTSQFTPTADNKHVVVQKTSGDLFVYDTTAKTLGATALATGAAKFTIAGGANGPVAYLGLDGSVHVIGLDGTKMLDVAASQMTSVNAPIVLAADGAYVYFFQNGNLQTGGVQNNMGTLMACAAMSGAMPVKVADNASIVDLRVTDSAILFLQNLMAPPATGIQFGDAAKANRDGSGVMALGMKVPVGGLMVVNPGPDTWFAMNLTMAVDDTMGKTTIDNSPLTYGALSWNDYTGAAAVTLDAKVQQGEFAFADDGRTAAFVSNGTYDSTLAQYTGALKMIASRSPSMSVDGMLAGAAQLGPIVNRSMFVSAPKATMAGIYFVKY